MITFAQALNTALRDALGGDERVLVLGQDVGRLGGVFRVTADLQKEFGPRRVMDTPLAESGIVGTAIGLALRGFRPVCEIQFDGFVYPAFNQIVSQLAKMHARTRGTVRLPVVIRIPVGGGIGAVEHHSESNEAYFAHTPGLRVVACADPGDAYWLLREAVECDDPVVFFEPKRRYWDKSEALPCRPDDALNRARVVRPGTDATLLSYGGAVATCLAAAGAAAGEGISLEVVDLRTLAPLDTATIVESVQRTTRCVVVHEASVTGGLGAELAALVQERCFDRLEAPVHRVGGLNIPYPPAKFEHIHLPDLDRVLHSVDAALAW